MLEKRLVHFDLKGALPKPSYLREITKLIREWGATGIILEYEDTFPYQDQYSCIRGEDCFSDVDLKAFLKHVDSLGLEVVPLIQTFGHFEFVLKHDKFRHLRECENYPMSLCPANPASVETVMGLIEQIVAFHENLQYLHIGADEVFHIGECEKCKGTKTAGDNDAAIVAQSIYLEHVTNILRRLKEKYPRMKFLFWDDMLRQIDEKLIKDSGLSSDLAEPMVWQYTDRILIPQEVWVKYSRLFDGVWGASAFKGATGPGVFITDLGFHIENHKSWMLTVPKVAPLFKEGFRGFCLTGWQRYDHYACLCDLLPAAIPCLAMCLAIVRDGQFSPDNHQQVSKTLGFKALMPVNLTDAQINTSCTFPGCDLYRLCFELLRSTVEYELIIRNDRLLFFMTDYHVKHMYANPAHIEFFLPSVKTLLEKLISLKTRLELEIAEIYPADTVEEWIMFHVTPKIDKLKKIASDGQMLLDVGARPKTNPMDL